MFFNPSSPAEQPGNLSLYNTYSCSRFVALNKKKRQKRKVGSGARLHVPSNERGCRSIYACLSQYIVHQILELIASSSYEESGEPVQMRRRVNVTLLDTSAWAFKALNSYVLDHKIFMYS